MTDEESANLKTVRTYLAAIGSGTAGEGLRPFFTPDATQIEFPNRLNPDGGESDLGTILRRSEQGVKLLRGQTYEIRSQMASGSMVAVEAEWTGTLAVPVGSLAAGDMMRARFAIFFEFQAGQIRVQRNYDCFDPW